MKKPAPGDVVAIHLPQQAFDEYEYDPTDDNSIASYEALGGTVTRIEHGIVWVDTHSAHGEIGVEPQYIELLSNMSYYKTDKKLCIANIALTVGCILLAATILYAAIRVWSVIEAGIGLIEILAR
jgi:hypothetical protein